MHLHVQGTKDRSQWFLSKHLLHFSMDLLDEKVTLPSMSEVLS